MKNHLAKIAPLLSAALTVACLCACAENMPAEDSGQKSGLCPVTAAGGLIAQRYAFTDDGYYEIHSRPGTGANILYTDFASGQKVYLSSDINSSHNDERDTSYISDAYGVFYPLITPKGLVIISNTSDLLISKYGDKALGRISISSLSGSGRRTLYTLAANEWISDTSVIVRDSEKLYFIDYYLETETLGQKCRLVSIDLNSGEKQVLENIGGPDRVSVAGAFDNCLVMKKLTAPDPDRPWYEQIDSRENQIYTYDIYTDEKRQIFSYRQSRGTAVCRDSLLIYVDYTRQSVTVTDMTSGRQKNLSLTEGTPDTVQFISVDNRVFDGQIMLCGTDRAEPDKPLYFALNLSDGSMKQINLYSDGKFCDIYAETDDSFLVANGEFEYEVEYYIQGVPDKIKSKTVQFALIKKSDYWNSIPNFENINYDIYKNLNYS